MSPKPTKTPSPSLGLYRRIAFTFVLLVAVVLGVVLYVSTVRATIQVTPVEETVKTDFLLDIVKMPTTDAEIRGRVVSNSLGRTKPITLSGEGTKQVEGVSRGIVTLTNTSGDSQSLVKTTRLLTPDGVLFRLDGAVTVPAHGKATAHVSADKPGAAGDVKPTKFTIPGLDASRQTQVYAESVDAFTGGTQTVSALTQNDIDHASADLKTELEKDGEAVLQGEVGTNLKGVSYTAEIVQQSTDVPVGTETDHFVLTLTVKVVGVFFDQDAVFDLAQKKLYAALGPGRQFKNVNKDGLQATVEKYDVAQEKANVRVYLDGRAVVSSTASSLDPARFVGLSADDVKNALVSDGVASDVSVQFSPQWVSHVPRLKDHIYIEIE